VIRRNPITGAPVLLVPERLLRPHALGGDEEIVCPFCPGNEHETPPEIWRDGDPWSIRVVPNKYPAAERHEIVVETADHDAEFEDLDHAARIVDAWLDRYRALSPAIIFKNDGRAAGASLKHAHSQILGTPFVPPRLAAETAAFARAERCPLCHVDDEPLVRESEHYRVIAPRGSAFAYEHWIVPRAHAPDVGEPHELSSLLQSAARASRSVAPGFNWIFMTFPGEPRAHWYVAVIPRLAGLAGYEVGAGGAINVVDPEEAARTLRQRQ
jgi:UDPglucose--hexose-1-phosphate uridylyltransferase